jgi:hypothetical protein
MKMKKETKITKKKKKKKLLKKIKINIKKRYIKFMLFGIIWSK